MIISHDDDRLSWHGQISLERTDEYTRPWRLPFEQRDLFFPQLAERASTSAGVRIAFHSNTRRLAGFVKPDTEDRNRKLDLYIDGELVKTADLQGGTEFLFEQLPVQDKLFELWLPPRADFALLRLEVDDGATLRPYEDKRLKWMTYGSSITHCAEAASPSFTWPSIVARRRNLNLTCLGYGGHEHLDALVARFMRDRPADFISLKVGINVCGGATMNQRTFCSSIIGFVQILREKHPSTPIALISPIFCSKFVGVANAVGMTLQNYRDEVAKAADILQKHGDANIRYYNGLDLFGTDMGDLMPDGVHPNAEGYKIMGENFLKHIAPGLFGPA